MILVTSHSTLDCWQHVGQMGDAILGLLVGDLVDRLLVQGNHSLGMALPILGTSLFTLDFGHFHLNNLSVNSFVMEKG